MMARGSARRSGFYLGVRAASWGLPLLALVLALGLCQTAAGQGTAIATLEDEGPGAGAAGAGGRGGGVRAFPAADLTSCPELSIALINGVPFHYDVLAGLLFTLRPYSARLHVFVNRYTRSASADGAWDLLKWSKATFKQLSPNALAREKQLSYGVGILVSADYEPEENLALLRKMQFRTLIAIVHNSDYPDLMNLVKWTPDVRLFALSPHVAESIAKELAAKKDKRHVQWMLAALPFRPRTSCTHATEVDLMGGCLNGFAMQGKFSNLRRNYAGIWKQLLDKKAELTTGAAAPLFHIKVLGKGEESRLGVPPELEKLVKLHHRLQFRGYYEAIHHSFALIPALASDKYYTGKFSSTIVTSLTSGTPIIADQRFLDAYRMFNKSNVYFQEKKEQEVDVILRILTSPALQLRTVRQAMEQLRRDLNIRTAQLWQIIMGEACSAAGGESY